MDFRIAGLPAEPFIPFFAMSDADLMRRGARRVTARLEDAPAMQPCRVSLRDSQPGEVSILLAYPHLDMVASPYRSSGPIFVRQGVSQSVSVVNEVPAQQRTRLLSVRAYDAAGLMVDATVTEGSTLEGVIGLMFDRRDVAFLQAHYANRGCYACRIDRV